MTNTKSKFTSIFLTHKDVKDANPDWTDRMVEDYLATKRDLEAVADAGDESNVSVDTTLAINARFNELEQRLGSGDYLTCDDDGFTCDNDLFTCDVEEATA